MKLSERIRKWARGLPKGKHFADEVAQLEEYNDELRQTNLVLLRLKDDLEADNEALQEYAIHKKGCDVWNQTVRYFHDGEHDICDCGLDALLKTSK